jgi:hypothetical protein
MELKIWTPEPGRMSFTLFVEGNVTSMSAFAGRGTTVRVEGVCALYYRYRRHRRAYVARELSGTRHYEGLTLPMVNLPVAVIGRFRGRRIDVLRNAVWNLSSLFGEEVFGWDTIFWQRVCCLIDGCGGGNNRAKKSNLLRLGNEYLRGREGTIRTGTD